MVFTFYEMFISLDVLDQNDTDDNLKHLKWYELNKSVKYFGWWYIIESQGSDCTNDFGTNINFSLHAT